MKIKQLGTWDYIIVGGGSAGCVLANRLSENPEVSVLLLEAGGKDNLLWINIPCGYLYCIGNPRTDWCYKTTPEPGLNGRTLLYPRGKVLGGCSSINAMLYLRGQKRDYDEWARLTNDPGWSWDQVLPLFKRSERHHLGDDKLHGAKGEWCVQPQRLSWKILDVCREAMFENNIPKIKDFNQGDNEGSAFFEVNQRNGFRWNTSKAFLRPAMKRSNLTVMTDTLVDCVQFKNKRAIGVKFSKNGQDYIANNNIECILSAGAIGSPQILQRSGIGAVSLLKECNIPLVHELPGVGENLQDHLQLRMIFKVKNAMTMNYKIHSWWQKILMGLEYIFFRTGPLSMAPSQLGAFTKSDPSQMTANIEYHIQPLSLDKFGDQLHKFPAITVAACNLRPTSRGYVRINQKDPQADPTIMPNYLSTDEDRKVAVDALRITRQIMSQPALSAHAPHELKPGLQFQTDNELAKAAGDIGTTIFHPVGTCKMGLETDNMAVVDSHLRVFGVENLRIIDASIMPTITSGNTNSPTIMIAEKGADLIRKVFSNKY